MFLSRLLIDLGDNPDRPRPGRLWLRNIYHVHQRLCMAFPSESRKADDRDFLKPFNPEEFGNGQVHVERKADSGFLFRIDPHPSKARAVILVQSAVRPDWDYAFRNAGYLLAAPSEVKDYDPSFAKGGRFRFRLAANPTKKVDTVEKEKRRAITKEEFKKIEGRHGRRIPVPADQLIDWLARRAESGGFSIDKDSTVRVCAPSVSKAPLKSPTLTFQPGYVYMNKMRDGDSARLRSVRFEGVLEVIDADKFRNILTGGIGSGKAFGFGLLSVAPLPAEVK